ncbi:MAG: VCBS repeat-containing protein [Chitinophagaceae bacterium]|nr:VCBS repeat-containing protein [Chitinophagaceae bacterium]
MLKIRTIKKIHLPVCIMLLLFCISCQQSNTLFKNISSFHSNIKFNNEVVENDSINPLDMEYLYNGGGVAIGDFNRDGRPDLYFTASQVENKMYLNKGDFVFEDITTTAKVNGEGRWCNGASVVDINNDGLDDIYVCASVKKDPLQRTNLFYINQGNNKDNIPVFREMAKEFNLADTGYSVHAAFFDYDRDGDLDVYIATTSLAQRNATRFDGHQEDQKHKLSDKLYRNEGSDSLGHPFFKDVSKEAGIEDYGYALGIAIADVNNDGWKDIYVTNDFYSSDLLYINNGNGTFTDEVKKCFKHTSQNAMGNDIADINNDGLQDIIAVDMNPEDNFRKKKNMGAGNYFVYQSMISNELMLQYVRNTLQLNNGLVKIDSGKKWLPSFSDISFYAGVAQTDWSWNTSLADFDNDGFKDLIITNGYPKDVTDHDFAAFRKNSSQLIPKKKLLEQIPQIKIPNYAYRNTGHLQFENVTKDWGFAKPCFSTGAIYADLDGDGDLDYVINNINDEALVYKNTLVKSNKNNYLNISFKGNSKNKNGIGAVAQLFYKGQQQIFENSPYRGYLSSVSNGLHFGLGSHAIIDTLLITWPDGKHQLLINLTVNQNLKVNYSDAKNLVPDSIKKEESIFVDITHQSGLKFMHQEFDYIDFDKQTLLPRRFSQYGPSIAAGDVDGNGLDDIFLGASGGNNAYYFLQDGNGEFREKMLTPPSGKDVRFPEMMGVLLFDADTDGDLDLYAASGSNEFVPNTKSYQDRFYINDGKGNFKYDSLSLPKNLTSKSCVKGADFDRDGDLDLFVGGRINPNRYPEPVNSFIYRNDTKNGHPKFTDITNEVAPFFEEFGLVCDAIWSDFDNDGWIDLIIAAEWMPLRFLRNNRGKFIDVTAATGIQNKKGWWDSIAGGDFDNDGDMDYVVGNLGLNSFFKASENQPVSIYGGDFNKDGTYDAIPSLFLPDENGLYKEFPAHVRDDMTKQIVGIRKKYNSYKDYGRATIHEIVPNLQAGLVLKVNDFASIYIENKGGGIFRAQPLPAMAQFAPIYGIIADDINEDGQLDLLLSGNDHGNEIVNGHYDAMNGLILLGDGNNGFQPLNLMQSGLYIPGDGKGLIRLKAGDRYAIAATQNKNVLKIFALTASQKTLRLNNDDKKAIIYLKNGKKRAVEIYYGGSFLSQSSRILLLNNSMQKIEITNLKEETRTITL